ncbi:MAG TPA: beta-eliminating lyase-related protein [Stenotrophomonas sp.]|nr:beta-eliminating lyase-related protein [Stenotrophomonas sp.]
MDRRSFLATGRLAAALPLLGSASVAVAAHAAPASSVVNFLSDGLGLSPAEYTTQLAQVAAATDFEPDTYSLGGSIEQIEQAFARRLGKPAALFLPTGTLANHLAVRALAGGKGRVLVQAESHLYNDSGDCATVLSALNLVPVPADNARLPLDAVRAEVERAAQGRVPMKIGAISLESPVRRLGHRHVPWTDVRALCDYARGEGIGLHLDGARLFNLPQHTGHSVREYTALFDTVYVSLWKHFNAASGAILAGEAALIEPLRAQRRMFGSGLPHAWPLVGPAQRYLQDYEQQYARAWQAAEQVFAALQADGRLRVQRLPEGTSSVALTLPDRADAQAWAARASASGVRVAAPPPGGNSMLQVNATLLRRPPQEVANILLAALAS